MKFTFIGCSQTVGDGLAEKKSDSDNYANIVSRYYGAEVKNLAEPGNVNHNMFVTAVDEILNDAPDQLFVQWTSDKRIKIHPGPKTTLFVGPNMPKDDYQYRQLFISAKQMQNFADMFGVLCNDYEHLRKVIHYCNLLEKLAQGRTKIVFINGVLKWQPDLEIEKFSDFEQELSSYTKSMLDFDNRDDSEIEDFLSTLTSEFRSMNKSLWVNLFENFGVITIDLVNQHPGPHTNHVIAQRIIDYLERTQ